MGNSPAAKIDLGPELLALNRNEDLPLVSQ